MRIYLAARYSRRLELCGYRDRLRVLGHNVQSRWLDGKHQISDVGVPIGDDGEALVEDADESTHTKCAALRSKFADDDLEDVSGADLLIAFTEPPRSGHSRGGRHVEFGIALGRQIPVIVVGHRENLFCWLKQVKFCGSFEAALVLIAAEEGIVSTVPGRRSVQDELIAAELATE